MMTIFTSVRWYFSVVFIYISLLIDDVEHLFMCLLITWMSSLEKCQFRSSAHFWLVSLFWWCCASWAVCRFWSLIPCWSHHFLPVCWLLFVLFISAFAVQKLLSLSTSHLFLFLFPSFWEMNHCCNLCDKVFCLCFPLGVIVSGLTFRSLIYFELIFVYNVKEGSNFIFYMFL